MTVSERIGLLKGSLDIDLLEDALGMEVVKEMGDEDICRCPLPSHDGVDSNPSFSINRVKLVYHCFACGVGGNVIDLVARVLDVDYEDAYKFCKTYDDKNFDRDDPFAFGRKLETIFSSQHDKRKYAPLPRFNKEILKRWISCPTDYFTNRGLSEEVIAKYSLGYDLSHKRADYTGPAAIIPHFFEGALVGYQERWIDNDRPKSIPKYTNTKGFPKAETLFGYDFVVGNTSAPVIVVESALTAVYLDRLGYSSVATFGATVTDEQIRLLRSFSWGVTLAFDNDSAGHGARDMVSERLRKTLPIHILDDFGENKADLNDLNAEEVAILVENAKPWFMKGL